MPEINPIENAYIDNVIKDNQQGVPDPTKTSGEDLQILIKLMRDRFEQELTKLVNEYTDVEARLNNLETHYKGVFVSLAALQAAFPTSVTGDYAHVDAGLGSDVIRYIWDDSDAAWVIGGGSLTDFANTAETLAGVIDDKAVQPQALEAKFDATKIYFSENHFLGTGSSSDPLMTKLSLNFNSNDFSGNGSLNEPIRIKFKEFLEGLPGWVADESKVLTSNLTWQVIQSSPLLAIPGLMSTVISETEIANNFSAPSNADGPVTYVLQLANSADFSDASNVYMGLESQFNIGSLSPGTIYYLRLRASRSGFATSAWTSIAVTTQGSAPGYSLETTVLINFSNQYLGGNEDGTWNMAKINTNQIPGGNYTLTGLIGSSGENTGISIFIENFGRVDNSLYSPSPAESAIYPNFVMISGIYVTTTTATGLIRLYGLDPDKIYKIYLMGNTDLATLSAVFTYTAGSKSVTKTIGGGNFQIEDLAVLEDVSDGQTSVDILVAKISGAFNSALCSLVIEVSNNETIILNAPGLSSTAISETEITNNFTAPVNGGSSIIFELQVAGSADFSDAITVYNGLQSQFNISSLSSGTTYYLRLRASKSGYATSAWSTTSLTTSGTVPVYTVETSILINFSNQYLGGTDDGIWNMAKINSAQIQGGGAYTKSDLRGSPDLENTGVSIYIEDFDKVDNSLVSFVS